MAGARVWNLPNGLEVSWSHPMALHGNCATVQELVTHGIFKELDVDAVKHNLQQHVEGCASGGEAEVHFLRWHGPESGLLYEGKRVALKLYRRPDGHGGFMELKHDDDADAEASYGRQSLRKEVNVMAILQHSGFAERVPPVLGIVRHRGDMHDPPLYGYAMSAYRYGSLAGFIRDTCDRRVPDSVFAGFFSPPRATAEFSSLMQTLSRLHTGERGLMLQDLSSNNLLIRDLADGGCSLLLGDPSMCFLISDLQQPDCNCLVSTWLWGSLAPRYKRYDPTADCHSLSLCFLELWLCAEGAPCGLQDLVQMMRADVDRVQGHTFVRALGVAVLKRQASGSGSIVPRIRRELPVSWLQLWLLLLGTEDFASEEQLLSQQSHRRPAEADMVQASAELAGVAAHVEALGGGGLTAASLATPAGAALVNRCLRLHERLTALSQLEPPEGSPLVPLDPSLSWVAMHFMSQDHPLVAAMRAAQGTSQANQPLAFEPIPSKLRSFNFAVQDARDAAGCDPAVLIAAKQNALAAKEEEFAAAQADSCARVEEMACIAEDALAAADSYKRMLGSMCQEYRRVRELALLPPGADRGQLLEFGHLDPYLQECIHGVLSPAGAAAAAAPAVAAAAEPAAAGQPALQLPRPAGPPPAHPLAAAHQRMPQWPPAGSAGVQPHIAAAAAHASLGGPTSAGLPAQPFASSAAVPAGLAEPAGYSLLGSLPGSAAAAAAGAGACPPMASLVAQPAALSPAALRPAPPSAAAAAVPRSLAGPPPPSFLPQPLLLPAAAGGAGTPSTDLSTHTVAAGGPGDASPATSAGTSSPNKRKRGATWGAPVAPGTILRFAASRDGCIAGLSAFRLPPYTVGSNLYAYMVAQLSERLRGDVHLLLEQRQGPYAALLGASGLQPAQLDSLVAGSGSGDAYIEVSAASFLPRASAEDHASAAPIVFHSSSRGTSSSYEQQIECGGGSAEAQAQYGAALQDHLKQSLAEGVPLAYGSSATATVLFRIALTHLPQGAAAMAWVPHEWEVPAADLAAVMSRAKHLFRKN